MFLDVFEKEKLTLIYHSSLFIYQNKQRVCVAHIGNIGPENTLLPKIE